MEKMDPSQIAPTESRNPRLKRVNKSLILYSLLGVAATALIGSSLLPDLFKRSKDRDSGRSTVNVPNPPEYEIEYPVNEIPKSSEASPDGDYPQLPAPPYMGDFEAAALAAEDTPAAAPSRAAAPAAPQLEPYKTLPFQADFSSSAAGSSMTVQTDETSPATLSNISQQLPGVPAAVLRGAGRQVGQRAAPVIPTTVPDRRQPTPYENYNQANQQTEKIAFAGTPGDTGIAARLGPYSVAQGTVIPALLVTGINTDLPGYIMSQVSENVYDFVSGENLLIPAGSRLVATYNSVVSWGQSRIQVSWQRMIRPDGTVVNLAGAPGIDAAGYSGLPANVDNHALEILGAIGFSALTTFLTGATNAAVDQLLTKGALSASMESVISQLGNIGFTIAQRWLDVQPTLTLKAGAKVNVFVTSDVTLPPAEPAGEIRKYIRRAGQ